MGRNVGDRESVQMNNNRHRGMDVRSFNDISMDLLNMNMHRIHE